MAFTGRATYDSDGTNTVWKGIAEDVSDIISMISPTETPLLDLIGDGDVTARSTYHEWLEEDLAPNTVVSSATVDDSATALAIHSGGVSVGDFLMVGTVLKNKTTGEYLQVSASAGNTISFTRAFGSTSAATITAADVLAIVSTASLEGADVATDISRPRVRKGNYVQLFRRDVIVSLTEMAVTHIGVANELEHQKMNRTRELLLDIERALIIGKSSGNTIGSSTAYRTAKGIWDSISTNATSTGTLTTTYLEDVIQDAWEAGGTDCNLIVCDAAWKRVIDSWNSSRVEVMNEDSAYRQRVTVYEGTFGVFRVLLNRWMPANSLMVLAPNRIKVVPLAGRSPAYYPVARTGDAEKGYVATELTFEVKSEAGMSRLY